MIFVFLVLEFLRDFRGWYMICKAMIVSLLGALKQVINVQASFLKQHTVSEWGKNEKSKLCWKNVLSKLTQGQGPQDADPPCDEYKIVTMVF